MADLSHEQKAFVVRCLAAFMTPQETATSFAEEFKDEQGKGIVVSRQQVRHYNPAQSPELSQEWRELHAQERERFKAEFEAIPIANKAVRLRWLNSMAERALQAGNALMVGKMSEQAAREMGDSYTNRREITGADGGAVELVATVADYRAATQAFAPPPAQEPNVAPGE